MFGQTVCPDVKERACLSKDSTYVVACCHYPQETDPNFMAVLPASPRRTTGLLGSFVFQPPGGKL